MPTMPQNKKAEAIAQKIMGANSQTMMTAADLKRMQEQLKKETGSLVRS